MTVEIGSSILCSVQEALRNRDWTLASQRILAGLILGLTVLEA